MPCSGSVPSWSCSAASRAIAAATRAAAARTAAGPPARSAAAAVASRCPARAGAVTPVIGAGRSGGSDRGRSSRSLRGHGFGRVGGRAVVAVGGGHHHGPSIGLAQAVTAAALRSCSSRRTATVAPGGCRSTVELALRMANVLNKRFLFKRSVASPCPDVADRNTVRRSIVLGAGRAACGTATRRGQDRVPSGNASPTIRNEGRHDMNADELRALQTPFKDRYRDDPGAAVITLRAAGTLDSDGIACRVDTGRALVDAGLHPSTGGSGELACSGDMLLEALAACAGVTLRAVATSMGISVSGQLHVEGDLDFRGTLGVAKDAPVGFTAIRVRTDIETDASDEQRATLLRLTERYCVVLQTIRSAPPVTIG